MRNASRELYRNDGIVYRIAQESDGAEMTRLLASSFAHEPLGRALGLTEQELAVFVSNFIPECTTNGLSVVAVPEDAPGKLAGVFINRDFKAPLPRGIPDDYPRFGPIIDALVNVDTQYEEQCPGLQQGQAVDLWMVAVELKGHFTRKGTARNLFRLSAEVARENGFQRCITECTGHYSQRAALASGFQEKATLHYNDYRFEGRPVFASIPAPHERLILFERMLDAKPSAVV
jgi:hypothetical protein